MRLPGTRYQEHGWEQVRKLLGHCSLRAFARFDPALLLEPDRGASLALYVDGVARALRASGGRLDAAGNSYGDTVAELALALVYELQARPGDWEALCAAVAGEHARLGRFWEQPGGGALLRKKCNDMYAVLRDKVDSDNYQAACGRPCSPNRMYAYRMLDTAYHEIARLFDGWREHAAQVGAILGRTVEAMPIEVRGMRSIADCRAEWVLRWSASLEAYSGAPGPLHTRSKRFASLKTSPEKIAAMLREIGDYEQLSSNGERDWLQDTGAAEAWLDDYWRVLDASEQGRTPGPDQILEARQDALDAGQDDQDGQEDQEDQDGELAPEEGAPDEAQALRLAARAQQVSLPPSYLQAAAGAQRSASWAARRMAGDTLPVRLAVYLKLLGPFDDSYPAEWLDPATGELPTMQQLAGLDGISLPTLRKRRDAAIARLQEAAPREEGRWE